MTQKNLGGRPAKPDHRKFNASLHHETIRIMREKADERCITASELITLAVRMLK